MVHLLHEALLYRSKAKRINVPILLLFIRIRRGGWCGLHCAHRATTASPWVLCEHRDRVSCLATPFPSLLVSLFGGLPGRASTARGEREPSILSSPSFKRGGPMVLACAHRGTTVSSWGLCEQEGPSDHSLLLS